MSSRRHYQDLKAPATRDPVAFIEQFTRTFVSALNQSLRLMLDQIPDPVINTGNEIVGGVIDGMNDTFVLLHEPHYPDSLLLFNIDSTGVTNLLVQAIGERAGVYRLHGSTVTFLPGFLPQTDDQLIAFYGYLG